LQALAGSVEFSVDKAAGMQVITIRDPKSGDVIRQLPSEEALKVARQLANGQGGLINRSA
jgi:flagellar protein FlaG